MIRLTFTLSLMSCIRQERIGLASNSIQRNCFQIVRMNHLLFNIVDVKFRKRETIRRILGLPAAVKDAT